MTGNTGSCHKDPPPPPQVPPLITKLSQRLHFSMSICQTRLCYIFTGQELNYSIINTYYWTKGQVPWFCMTSYHIQHCDGGVTIEETFQTHERHPIPQHHAFWKYLFWVVWRKLTMLWFDCTVSNIPFPLSNINKLKRPCLAITIGISIIKVRQSAVDNLSM